jgi:hypothetical protein
MPKHNKIAIETIERIFKSGGTVFFKNKMSGPGKAISDERRKE